MFLRALLVGVFAALTMSACRTKSSAVIYSGSGPSVHYHETETAGGPVRNSRYH